MSLTGIILGAFYVTVVTVITLVLAGLSLQSTIEGDSVKGTVIGFAAMIGYISAMMPLLSRR